MNLYINSKFLNPILQCWSRIMNLDLAHLTTSLPQGSVCISKNIKVIKREFLWPLLPVKVGGIRNKIDLGHATMLGGTLLNVHTSVCPQHYHNCRTSFYIWLLLSWSYVYTNRTTTASTPYLWCLHTISLNLTGTNGGEWFQMLSCLHVLRSITNQITRTIVIFINFFHFLNSALSI